MQGSLGDFTTLGFEAPSLRAGQRLGRYELVAEAGRGGMGVVWRARDTELDGRPVALKFLPTVLARDPLALKLLRREATAMLELSHPGIVRLHNLERQDEILFLAMELVEGPTLRAALAERFEGATGFTADDALWVLEQVAPALEYAHGRLVLHRDIKPANIMLTQAVRGELRPSGAALKLCDFGIAHVASITATQLTGRQPTTGTLPYMAPELLEGEPPSVATDVYAMGATIFELVRGEPPFARGDLFRLIREKRAPELGSGNAGLDELVARALEKDPARRPAAVRALAAEMAIPATPRPPQRDAQGRFAPGASARLTLPKISGGAPEPAKEGRLAAGLPATASPQRTGALGLLVTFLVYVCIILLHPILFTLVMFGCVFADATRKCHRTVPFVLPALASPAVAAYSALYAVLRGLLHVCWRCMGACSHRAWKALWEREDTLMRVPAAWLDCAWRACVADVAL